MKVIFLLLVTAAGVAGAAQSAANGALANRATLGAALLINSLIVIAGSAITFFATGGPRASAAAWGAPWHFYIGGVCGFFIVATLSVAVPRLGAGLALATMVLGQGVMALLIDHHGMWGLEARPVTVWRLVGIALLVAGVVLLRR